MKWSVGKASALLLALPLLAAAAPAAKTPAAWPGCCGLAPWAQAAPLKAKPNPRAGPLFGGFSYLVAGSPLRHHLGATGQIPAPYAQLRNPLAPTPQNAQAGAAIYEAQCASCHGVDGLGDGPGSRDLKPPPAELGWLAQIPPGRRDAFMYWAIADGGQKFGSAMPGYKDKLSEEQIWSVIGYIQARLPPAAPPKPAPH